MQTTANDSEGVLSNCPACGKPDNLEDVVACHHCNLWYHYSCVGVNESTNDRKWSCDDCLKTFTLLSNASKSGKSKASSRSARMQLQLQQLEEAKLSEEKLLHEKQELDRKCQEKELEEKAALEKKYREQKYALLFQEAEEDADSFGSKHSQVSSSSKVRQWMLAQRKQLEEAALHSENVTTKNLVVTTSQTGQVQQGALTALGELGANSGAGAVPKNTVAASGMIPSSTFIEERDKINPPLQLQTPPSPLLPVVPPFLLLPTAPPPSPLLPTAPPPISQINPQLRSIVPQPLQFSLSNHWPLSSYLPTAPPQSSVMQQSLHTSPGAPQPPLPAPIEYSSNPPYPSVLPSQPVFHQAQRPNPAHVQFAPQPPVTDRSTLSPHLQFQQQLAARQVVPKELPIFAGNPEDWPLFVSCYRNSTALCGYSDAENLMRLQKCLRGCALDAVRSNLLLPSSVPQVMATLETLFGSPERLVQCSLNKVRTVPAPKAEKLETLINFGLVVQNLVGHLKAANMHAHLANPALLQELVEKLPANIRLDWALHKKRVGVVDLGIFGEYMSAIMSAASDVTTFNSVDSLGMTKFEKPKVKERAFVNAHAPEEVNKIFTTGKQVQPQNKQCFVCHGSDHRVKDCRKFRSQFLHDRLKIVQLHQLCGRCLVPHGRWPCKSTRVCDINGCQLAHHPLLHQRHSSAGENSGDKPNPPAVVSIHQQEQCTALFRIVPVVLYGNNCQLEIYAFLDEGSSVTLVDKSVADQLGVEGEVQPLCLKWTSNVTRRESDSRRVKFEISSKGSKKCYPITNVRTVTSLDLPEQTMRYQNLAERFPHLKGLPIESYEKATPRLLIGLNHLHLALPRKLREGRANEPVAVKTKIGWTVFGTTDRSSTACTIPSFHICECTDDSDLNDLVNRYFAVDSLGVSVVPLPEGVDDKRAKEILRQTTVRRPDGRFETGLLWRFHHVNLPDSYPMAERRLRCLERRLQSAPELRANVKKQIEDYQSKGYAHKATQRELNETEPGRVWYLPLGVVVNPKKPGKVRIIWDAAFKVEGVSFNSMLLKGPDLLTSLPSVLSHFRQRQVAITGDIREMYHQIAIREEDRQFQRFLWRSDPSKPPEVFVMDVATFGSTCSPCAAHYAKNLNAEEWSGKFPEAAVAIVKNHYVDDFLDSRDTEEEIIKLAVDVRTVHSKAGFEIRNWLSNSGRVLEQVGDGVSEKWKELRVDKTVHVERVLGMTWLSEEDEFIFSVTLSTDQQHLLSKQFTTKRNILRFVMSLFDPLGLISNLLIHGKLVIQELWRCGVGWDDKIPESIHAYWRKWILQLSALSELRISRCYFPDYETDSYRSLQVHVFVDASEAAYACVGYFRIVDRGQPRCILVASKAKVAPLKPLSVPRLELQAAVIGTRLLKSIGENHSLPVSHRFIWSDSRTVLSWIRSDTRKYRQYVAVRIGEILEETRSDEWRWVPTHLNVADEATKWGKGPSVEQSSRWHCGPEFLLQPEKCWPAQQTDQNETIEEMRSLHVHHEVVQQPIVNYQRFSKWERMLRSTAYVFHFLLRKPDNAKNGSGLLSQEDYQRAERTLWRIAQAEVYDDEIASLVKQRAEDGKKGQVEKTSVLYRLSPFLDNYEVLRMEGRIEASPTASYDLKYPVILPRNHRITYLLIDWYHRKFGHINGEIIVNEIRQRFQIANLRTEVRRVTKLCVWCSVYKAKAQAPRMAPLPEARVTPSVRPFSFIGIDYFGPFSIKILRSNVKRWVALFTCLTVRAVHLEVTASLSTESCKLAIRRFIARRGAPLEIYTDHGTNFVGASRELAEQIAKINENAAECFTNVNTKWCFIPPASPHMGGAWERMVRSVKAAMYTINQSRTPTEEVFQTVICEAESMVNSRPLTSLTSLWKRQIRKR